MARIPAEVWQFCVKQVKLYPIYKKRWKEEWANIEIKYLHAGGNRELDPNSAGVPTGNISPTERRYEIMEETVEALLDRPDLFYYKKCMDRMHDVMAGLEEKEKQVLEAVWSQGWRYNDVLAETIGSSKADISRVKHEIIERLAVSWGMWVA